MELELDRAGAFGAADCSRRSARVVPAAHDGQVCCRTLLLMVEILERLLLEAGVSPWAYMRALPHATKACRDALRSLRQSALG